MMRLSVVLLLCAIAILVKGVALPPDAMAEIAKRVDMRTYAAMRQSHPIMARHLSPFKTSISAIQRRLITASSKILGSTPSQISKMTDGDPIIAIKIMANVVGALETRVLESCGVEMQAHVVDKDLVTRFVGIKGGVNAIHQAVLIPHDLVDMTPIPLVAGHLAYRARSLEDIRRAFGDVSAGVVMANVEGWLCAFEATVFGGLSPGTRLKRLEALHGLSASCGSDCVGKAFKWTLQRSILDVFGSYVSPDAGPEVKGGEWAVEWRNDGLRLVRVGPTGTPARARRSSYVSVHRLVRILRRRWQELASARQNIQRMFDEESIAVATQAILAVLPALLQLGMFALFVATEMPRWTILMTMAPVNQHVLSLWSLLVTLFMMPFFVPLLLVDSSAFAIAMSLCFHVFKLTQIGIALMCYQRHLRGGLEERVRDWGYRGVCARIRDQLSATDDSDSVDNNDD
jgi:hypothetical protein